MTTSADVVHGFVRALGIHDFEAAQTLLSKEFTFRGPFDTFDDPKAYLEAEEALPHRQGR
jgi:hypothetical protein